MNQTVAELMTREVVTVKEGVDMNESRRLLHQHRIEKFIVVDDDQRCIGLITVNDMEKAAHYPDASKDSQGRLLVAAATSTGDANFARARTAD